MSDLLVSLRTSVLHVRIARPERHNALSRATLAELREVFAGHAGDASLKAAVITGTGESSFAAGGDLRDLGTVRTREAAIDMVRGANAALTAIRMFPVPVIAALNGRAIGGGAELAVSCDFRVAAQNASIGFVHGKLGLSSQWGGGTTLTHLLGAQKALYAMATGTVYGARAALELGLVDAVCETGESLESAVEAFLAPMLAMQPQVLRAAKALAADQRDGVARERSETAELTRAVDNWLHPDHWAAADGILKPRHE